MEQESEQKNLLPPKKIAEIIFNVCENRNANYLKTLYVKELTVMADYIVLVKAGNDTHAKSILGEIEKKLSEKGEKLLGKDGYNNSHWLVADFNTVMLHLFFGEEGNYYYEALEKVWTSAEVVEF